MRNLIAIIALCLSVSSGAAQALLPLYPNDRRDAIQSISDALNLCIEAVHTRSFEPLEVFIFEGRVPDISGDISRYYRTEDSQFWISFAVTPQLGASPVVFCKVEASAIGRREDSLRYYNWFVNNSEELALANAQVYIVFSALLDGYYSMLWPLCDGVDDALTLYWSTRSRADWFFVKVQGAIEPMNGYCDPIQQ